MHARRLLLIGLLGAVPAVARAWTFTDVTAAAGLTYQHGYAQLGPGGLATAWIAGGVAAGDYDGDGWVDLYVVRGDIGPNLLFHNRGDGNFGATSSKQLWHNNGDGTFSDVSIVAGIAAAYTVPGGIGDLSFTPNFADIDDDGWPDLLVAGDFGTSRVFLNNRDGTFRNVTDRGVITDENGMGGAIGDYD